jgi:hypothetical protein
MSIARPLLLLVATLALASGVPSARAGEHGHGRKHGRPPLDALLERHAERLALDAGTLAQIRAAADASRPEHERLAERCTRSVSRCAAGEEAPDREP